MSRVSRREDAFYSMFSEFSVLTVSAAKLFVSFIENYPDHEDLAAQITNYESLCDDQVGKIISTLNTSFITPFDREDISELALLMDDIVDGIESVTTHIDMYDIAEMRKQVRWHILFYLLPKNFKKHLNISLITIRMILLLTIRVQPTSMRIKVMMSIAMP